MKDVTCQSLISKITFSTLIYIIILYLALQLGFKIGLGVWWGSLTAKTQLQMYLVALVVGF